MKLRPAGLALLLLASVAAGLAPALGLSPVTGFLVLTGAVLVCALDGSVGAPRSAVTVRRNHARRASVGRPATVEVVLESRSRRRLAVTVRDGAPDALHADRRILRLVLPPGGGARSTYALWPDRRGAYTLEACWIEAPGLLGLVARTFEHALLTRLAVIPDVQLLRSWDVEASRALTARWGMRRLRRPGGGTELETLREYEPGDDPRLIDWKATARRLIPITAVRELERSRNVVFLVDAGRWMAQPVDRLLKVDHALNAVLMAAHVADRNGDLTGALVFSDRVLAWRPAARGRHHRSALLEDLHRAPVEAVEPDFELAFRFVARHVRKRSLLVLLSDLSDAAAAAALQRTVSVVARRHLVLCAHVLDPAVERHAGANPEHVVDVARRSVAEGLRRERRRTLDGLRSRGVHVVACPADRLTVEVVNRYLGIKERGEL